MRDRIYLDASFFVALQIREHTFHKRAIAKKGLLQDAEICFSMFTLDESIHAFRKHKIDQFAIKEAIEEDIVFLPHSKLVSYRSELPDMIKYVNEWVFSDLRSGDALHLFMMKTNGIKKMLTFDNDFIERQDELGIEVI
ncbi:MAG: type II toxin-antitoxin system VapC family toxin [Candidatus Dojkabacteria bacterium]